MRRPVVIGSAFLVAFACSKYEATTSEAPPDAGTDTSTPPPPPDPPGVPDASDSGKPACDPAKPFTILAESIPGLEATNIGGITLTADELDAVLFEYDDAGGYHLVEYRRATTSAAFGQATPLTELDIGIAERAALDADGLTIAFSATYDGGDALFWATRASRTDRFGVPKHLDALDVGTFVDGPYFAHGAFWFSAGTPGKYRIFRAGLTTDGPVAPVLVEGLDKPASNYVYPVPSEDGLAIYWSGSPNVFRALRPRDIDPFGIALPVNEIQVGGQFEQASWLSHDRCRLYYVRGANSESRALVARH